MGKISIFFSSGLGIGYLPKAPGTFGTLWGVLFFWLGRDLSPEIFTLLVLAVILAAVFFSHFTERQLKSHDSSVIVIDEIAGYLVAVLGFAFSWQTAVLAFILFRIFDIWKPFPVRQLDQKLPGAWGVVLDDVMAGVYANIILRGLLFIIGKWI